MKKILIVFMVLLTGVLTLYLYSENNQKSLAPALNIKQITAVKKIEVASSESHSGFMDVLSIPATEIKEILPVKEAVENPSEETIYKKEPAIKAEDKSKVIPAVEGKKEKIELPSDLVEQVSPIVIKIKDEAGPAAKKESIPAQEPSGGAEKITAVKPVVEEIIEPVSKPVIMKEEETAVPEVEIRQPIAKMELAGEGTRVVEEKTDTIPAGVSNVMPIETPIPALVQQSSVGTKDFIPERAKEQPSVKMEMAVAVSHSEKAAETKEGILSAVKTEGHMEKPEPGPGEMLTKGNNKRIAIFPFENLSDNRDAFRHVLPLLIDKMQKKGFEVVDEDDLNSFLCKERVRSTGYVSRELSDKIRKRFKVSAILTGAIVSFSTEEIPQFGILARMIDTSNGVILWAEYSAATGEDFIAILELGRLKTVFSLMPKVVDILFASFKAEELKWGITPLHRVAAMPFKNNSGFNNAGIIATYMFIAEMLKSRKFMPIEYGDTRDIIIKLGIRRKGDIGYDNISELSKELKARGILVGVVDSYSDGLAGSSAPNVGITARLIDGSNNKILWYNSYQLSGEENIVALDWGRIRSVHSVAYKAISNLVKEMSKKKWPD